MKNCTLFFSALLFLLVCSSNQSMAQLCQGSLGDPIINITFGAGTNPGPPISAATTNMQYVTTDCPNDGSYTVRNNTSSCFGDSWFTLTSDHTGNPGGYFMLVNASYQPSAFYLDTVRGLCSNTVFEFAAWVMNVQRASANCGGSSILPDLTFRIERTDGTLLQQYNTNGIPTSNIPDWNQYGFFFTTPAGVADVVLRIVNNAPGGCGNDLALDDITFRPCGPMITVAVTGAPSTNISYCAGTAHAYQFSATLTGGFSNPAYQWQQNINNAGWTDISGATASSIPVNFPAAKPPGSYLYRVAVTEAGNISSLQCRVFSPQVSVVINGQPVVAAGNNGPACIRKQLQLHAGGGNQYSWTGPGGFTSTVPSPVINNVQAINAGRYYVQVTNAAGCQQTDSTDVLVNPTPLAATAFADTSICAGSSITLSGSGGSSWQWIPATGLSSASIQNPVASPADTTQYLFIASNSFGCADTAYTHVNLVKLPVVDAGPDRILLSGNSIRLNGNISGQFSAFTWWPPLYINNVQTLQPVVNPTVDMDYLLQATALLGCGIVTDSIHIKVLGVIFIPNAFTPNGDGRNDTWNIPALSTYSEFELLVYNRFGEIVFHTVNSNRPWDGKLNGKDLPMGAYTYILDLKNGLNPITGSVLLIR